MLAKPLTHIYESLNTLFDPYICAYFSIWYHSLKYVNLVLIVVFFFSIWARCEIIVNVVCSMMCLNFEGRVGFVMLE